MLDVAPLAAGEVLPGNGLVSTLANSILATDTSLNIQAADAANWPAGGTYRAVLCQDPLNGPFELVQITGGQGSSTLQVTRAAESYNGAATARAWPPGTTISAVMTQAGIQAILAGGGNYLPITGGTLSGPGNLSVIGTMGVGGASVANIGLSLTSASLTGTSQYGAQIVPVFSSAATVRGAALYPMLSTQAATFTMVAGYGIFVASPSLGAASVVTTTYGIYVGNQGISATATPSNYGIYIADQSRGAPTQQMLDAPEQQTVTASYNVGLYNGGNSWLNGVMAIGAVGGPAMSTPSVMLTLGSGTTSTLQLTGSSIAGALQLNPYYSNNTGYIYNINSQLTGFATGWSFTTVAHLYLNTPNLQGATVPSLYGVYVGNQGATGVTNSYGLYIAAQSGSSSQSFGLYSAGTAYFFAPVSIGNSFPNSTCGLQLNLNSPFLTGTTQYGIQLTPTFTSAVTNGAYGLWVNIAATATVSTANVYAMYVWTPSLSAGASIGNLYGLYVSNQGATGVTNAYGIYVAAQAGAATTNLGIRNDGTTLLNNLVQVTNNASAPAPSAQVNINAATPGITSGTVQYGVVLGNVFMSSSCTSNYDGIYIGVSTQAATFTCSQATNLRIGGFALGSGSAITNAIGIKIEAFTGGTSRTVGIYAAQNTDAIIIGGGGTLPTNSCSAGIVFYATVANKICFYDAGSGNFYGMGINAAEVFLCFTAGSSFAIRQSNQAGAVASSCSYAGAWTGASFTPSSSRSFKAEIQPLRDPLRFVRDETLHGVTYLDTRQDNKPSIGFVADDWLEPAPQVVVLDDRGVPTALDYDRIGAITFEALKQFVHQTEARLAALEAN